MLKTSGFMVKLFEGGLPFLKEAAGLEPGCVLLDVRMPDMDGLAVQRELRARGVMLPVVIMTGRGDKALDGWAKRARDRSEEHTSELQSLMRNSYAVFCLKKKLHYMKTKAMKQ